MIDFPNTPALNQSFSVSGKTWKWNGTAWLADSGYTLAPVALSGDYNDLLNKPSAVGGGTINDLDEMFNSARATYYHEVNYTAGGDVSSIEVYATSAKTTHLYSRSFTYDGNGNIATVTTTDQQNSGVSLTKTISYTGSGDVATVTRNYTGTGGGGSGGGGGDFTPASLPGLQLWLDADDATTLFDSVAGGANVSVDGTAIARWEDKSGNEAHVTQEVVNQRPLFKTLQTNEKPGIYFDRNDFLAKSRKLFTTNVTIFAVAKFDSNTERNVILDIGSYENSSQSHAAVEQNTYATSGQRYGFYWGGLSVDSNAPTSASVKIFTLSTNASPGTGILSSTIYRINGTTSTLSSTISFHNGLHRDFSFVSGFVIGGYNSGLNGSPTMSSSSSSSSAMRGSIYEILVFNDFLTESSRQQVESYLSTKWGVAL